MIRRKYPQQTKKKACAGKVRYTREEAHKAAVSLHIKTGERIGSYKCPYCKGFHAGHTPFYIRNIIDNR